MPEVTVIDHIKPQKRRISWKAIGIIVLAAVLLVGIIAAVIVFSNWRNNGVAYAEKLSEQIGVSAETAQKYAHVTLKGASEYACINMAAEEYPYVYESTRTTNVMGVSIPQWVIYVQEENSTMTEVVYYDYRQLQNYGNGVKTNQKINPAGITMGMRAEGVRQYVGFDPLCRAYDTKGMHETYKYYFKDQNTGNTAAYLLTVTYSDGLVSAVAEEENYFILNVLTAEGK
jgi:hypothetical protein